MQAERRILETDASGDLINSPKLPANSRFEAIFLIMDKVEGNAKRTPHPDIQGKMAIKNDLLDTIPVEDWEFSAWLY